MIASTISRVPTHGGGRRGLSALSRVSLAVAVLALVFAGARLAADPTACSLHEAHMAAGAAGSPAAPAPTNAETPTSPPTAAPAECPLHEQHMAAAAEAERRRDLDERGGRAMGFSQEATRHHFALVDDGGSIEVTVVDPADTDTLAAVRSHLQEITRAFAAGDFSAPKAVHAMVPPGSEAMARRAAAIRYRYEEIPAGGRVVIETDDPEALAAVHDFLRFQIEDHATGDPVP